VIQKIQKKKILIIDDDLDLIDSVKSALEEMGRYEVNGENKGRRGVLSARFFQPDLILLDIMMPDLSGNEVARALSEDEQTKHIPVAYFTVIVCKEDVESSGGMIGRRRFISKPTSIEDLTRSIEEALKAA